MAWTAPRTWTDGELVTASIMNTHIRDNELALDQHLIVRKTSNQTVTSSTVLVNDTALVLPVSANEIWKFEFHVIATGASTGDIKIAFTFPAGGDFSAHLAADDSTGTPVVGQWGTTSSPTAARNFGMNGAAVKYVFPIVGTFYNGGTGGNVTLQWAQNASDVTATTVYANSTLWGVKLA